MIVLECIFEIGTKTKVKLLIQIFLLSFCFLTCSQVKKQKDNSKQISETENIKKCGSELIENDFLKYANPIKIDTLKTEIENLFYIYDEETYKFVHIDAEELAEFNFNFFLPQLNKILEKRNIELTVETAEDYENSNDIIINGQIVNLYSKQELENMTFWASAPKNFFREINKILNAKNSNEKFYLLYGGNDLSALLLTQKQFEIIKHFYKNETKEIPYLP